jgi:hypothetical protein
MFILRLYDRNGTELKPGDIVQISNGRWMTFWCEVKFLEEECLITPFHTFSFHSFEKVDKVPDHAVKSTEERYNIWYVYDDEADKDEESNKFDRFLSEWRHCEHLLETRMWRIEKLER